MSDKTKLWIKKAGIRAIKTFAQAIVGVTGGTAVIGSLADFKTILVSALIATGMSLITSLAGLPEIKDGE